MSKEKLPPTPARDGFAKIDEYHIRHLEGMILTVVDSLGFEKEPVREKAVKDLFRQQIWSWIQPHWDAASIHVKAQ